jgi:S-adenosylmethionine:tRNA ribosyltransferase-isomerase
MHLSDFDYELPPELIAQEPVEPRHNSRLLLLPRLQGDSSHHRFLQLPSLLRAGDLLIHNDTRVVAARLLGSRAKTGGKWEGLFVREHSIGSDNVWELLLTTRGKLEPKEQLSVESEEGGLSLELVEKLPSGRWLARPSVAGATPEILNRHGQIPIPPYIRKGRADVDDLRHYQTLYARKDGAVAAPTAGLHFTEDVFAELANRGIERAFVTLHVGPGTFQPVKVEDVRQHRVEAEWGELPEETARAIQRCHERQGRVIAVGTTSVRVLESAHEAIAQTSAWSGLTELTIMPGYEFRIVQGMITNFHLPKSSLLLLVSAFATLDRVRSAYAEAVRQRYRFYSYGDAMLLL